MTKGVSSNSDSAASARAGKGSPKRRKSNGRGGKPNYKKELLLKVIRKILPCGAADWNEVASKYQKHSKESDTREPDAIKNYWHTTMCNGGKKPTGKSGANSDPIRQAQEVAAAILAKNSSRSIGGGSYSGSSDSDNDSSVGDESYSTSSEESANNDNSFANNDNSQYPDDEFDPYDYAFNNPKEDEKEDEPEHEPGPEPELEPEEPAETAPLNPPLGPTAPQSTRDDRRQNKRKHSHHHHHHSPVGKTKNARVANPRSSAAGALSGMVDAIRESRAENSTASTMRTMLAAQQQQSQQMMAMFMQQQQLAQQQADRQAQQQAQQMQMQMQQQLQLFAMLAGRTFGPPSAPTLPQEVVPSTPATMVSPAPEVPK